MPSPTTLLYSLLAASLLALPQAALAAPKGEPGGGRPEGAGAPAHERHAAPLVDLRQVRDILLGHRQWLEPAAELPPGIRKNLASGKPVPLGIAKRLDGRLLDRLPHYDGYEWRQAGRDVILVALATGVITEILQNVLD